MVSALSKLGIAAIAVVGVLVLSPAAALADSCQGGTGAVSIYSECIPTASGGTHHSGGGHKTTTTPKTPVNPAPVYPTQVVPITVPKRVQKRIAHARHHKMLKRLLTDRSLGATQAVVVPASYRAATPSALGAVFDLGSGPMALFAMLAAVAIVLLGAGIRRGRRL